MSLGNSLNCINTMRSHRHVDRTRSQRIADAARIAGEIVQRDVIREYRYDNVTPVAGLCHGLRHPRAFAAQLRRLIRGAVVHSEVLANSEKPARDGVTHPA
jgi:hypothetical protein